MASMKALAAIALTLIVACPIGLGFLFATHEVPYDEWQKDTAYNVTDQLLNNETPIYITYTGTTNNTTLDSGRPLDYITMSTNPTSYPAMSVTEVSQTFAQYVAYDMSAYGSWSIQWYGDAMLNYTPDEGGYITGYPGTLDGYTTVSNVGGKVSFNKDTTATITSTFDDGLYADVSDGWNLPTNQEDWTNNQTNRSALFTVYLPDNAMIRIGNTEIINTSGTVTATYRVYPPIPDYTPPVYTFGNYSYFQMLVNADGLTLYGLDSWPRMDRTPVSYNTLEVPWGPRAGDFSGFTAIGIYVDDFDTRFRVDSTEILSGYFPDTLDATLDLNHLYPGRSYDLKLNSIGVYGDTITLAGQSYDVNLGRISVNGHTVALKGATISSYRSGDHFVNTINGIALDDTAAPASVYFGGEWSLTATAILMVEVTGERTEWNPGEFAFDKRDFAAVGMLVAGACLVGLGIYGQRSGVKIGLLLLICGGAALIYLTMV